MRASSRALGRSRTPRAACARHEIRGGAHRGAQRFNGARRRAEELLVRASPQPQANLRTRDASLSRNAGQAMHVQRVRTLR